jgi:IS30 family transposase
MASKSEDRKQHESQIRYWDSQGMSQRGIARKLGINRGVVQRVLGTAGAVTAPVYDQPDDFSDVQAEFDGMAEQARATNTVDGWRQLHDVAATCYTNGYRIKYNPLPLLMALSAAQAVHVSQPVWQRYHEEISQVYQWMRDTKVGDYSLTGDRGGVPEFHLAED